jgi:hypothetical protein
MRGLFYYLGCSFSKGSRKNLGEYIRSLYDTDQQGKAAPHTDYVSNRQLKRMLQNFSKVITEIHNCYDFKVGIRKYKLVIKRRKLLNNFARILGLDLYATAEKK